MEKRTIIAPTYHGIAARKKPITNLQRTKTILEINNQC
jgi:hypothetical protein